MKRCFIILLLLISFSQFTIAAPPQKSKFYDFGEQLIDGEIKKPTALYMDARKRARFGRLLRLKKSFLPKLFSTSKEKIFK
jgi:hypothetical protein